MPVTGSMALVSPRTLATVLLLAAGLSRISLLFLYIFFFFSLASFNLFIYFFDWWRYKGCFVDADTRDLPFRSTVRYIFCTSSLSSSSFRLISPLLTSLPLLSLSLRLTSPISGAMTVELCQSSCKASGYQYAGLQYSSECWCGNAYGRYGTPSSSPSPSPSPTFSIFL